MDVTADPGWRFDNTYARLPAPLYAPTLPSPAPAASVIVLNAPLAREMGLDPDLLGESLAGLIAGRAIPHGSEPIAQAYAGHQFGHFTNLGDGRALLLGEQIAPDGRRFDVHLKGSGRTRYSRGGDGKAALGPMLREYLVSEGMHALGVPTTRSLAVVATGQPVLRSSTLPGAVLVRVAASHIRVGTFQYAAAIEDRDALPALLSHAIARHSPEAAAADDPAVAFFETVVEGQASLLARWMLLGFVHGVMNTDNMAVSGETIDYGPCAFLDSYSPDTVFSSIDHQGRYAFGHQPSIARWNLARLAESLMPLVGGNETAVLDKLRHVFDSFSGRFDRHHLAGARLKLGLVTEEADDRALYDNLLERMHLARADFTSTFSALAGRVAPRPASQTDDALQWLGDWLDQWHNRLARQPSTVPQVTERMRSVNPGVIPRNHRVEEALTEAEGGDLTTLERLLAALGRPFAPTADDPRFLEPPPPGCGPYRTFCGT